MRGSNLNGGRRGASLTGGDRSGIRLIGGARYKGANLTGGRMAENYPFRTGLLPPPPGSQYYSKLATLPHVLNKMARLKPYDFHEMLDGQERLRGGAFPLAILPFLALLKPILGAAAIAGTKAAALGAVGYGGHRLAEKIAGKGRRVHYPGGYGLLAKRDSRLLDSFGGYVPSMHDTPIHKIDAINRTHKNLGYFNNMTPLEGGALGGLIGKIFGSLRHIVKNHGVAAVKKLVGMAKGSAKNVDISKFITKDPKKLAELVKQGSSKIGGSFKEVGKEFGKKIAKNAGESIINKTIAAAEDKLNKISPDKATQKKAKEAAVKAKTKKPKIVDLLMEEDVVEPVKKTTKRAAQNPATMTPAQRAAYFAELPFHGEGKKIKRTVKDMAQMI